VLRTLRVEDINYDVLGREFLILGQRIKINLIKILIILEENSLLDND
jgi:hypothetical protein